MSAAWDSARRILAVRLDSMGDVLMTTPAIRALAGDGRGVALLTSAAGAEVARLVPEIDEVIVYKAPWMKATEPRANSAVDLAMIAQLGAGQFDAAVIFTVFSQNPLPAALLCYLADIPLRLAHCHENPYQLLTDWVPDPEPEPSMRHEAKRQLDLVASVGFATDDDRLSLAVPPTTQQWVDVLLSELRLDAGQPWVVIHPGASASSRRYPAESFAIVADRLVQEDGWQVLFTGSEQEWELVKSIQARMTSYSNSLAGCLGLGELAALIARSPLLISNNTGPVHFAAALGTPVVDLYALTNPQHTPWRVPHRVLFHDVPCKYCYQSICPAGHHDCLRLVTPDEVVAAARSLASEMSPRGERGQGTGDSSYPLAPLGRGLG